MKCMHELESSYFDMIVLWTGSTVMFLGRHNEKKDQELINIFDSHIENKENVKFYEVILIVQQLVKMGYKVIVKDKPYYLLLQ